MLEKIVEVLKSYHHPGVIPPNWEEVSRKHPSAFEKIAAELEKRYGKWTGKTRARGRGKYTYLSGKKIHSVMRDLGYFQTEFVGIPPYRFPKD